MQQLSLGWRVGPSEQTRCRGKRRENVFTSLFPHKRVGMPEGLPAGAIRRDDSEPPIGYQFRMASRELLPASLC